MARMKPTARRTTSLALLRPSAVACLMYQLQQVAPQLEAAAAVEDVVQLERLLSTAASEIADLHEGGLRQPSTIQLASMSPVPATVECLVAAGASVLGEDTTVPAWERTRMPVRRPFVEDWAAGPRVRFFETRQQYSCLLLAAKHSTSLEMLPLLVRTTLQQAKQQHKQQQQEQQQQPAWDQVLFDLLKGALACRPRRAALMLQQVAELEGTAAATQVVTRLLDSYMQLRQDSSKPKDAGVRALTQLAQALLLVWFTACRKVLQQRVALVTPLQQAFGVLLPLQGQQQAVQQAQQLLMLLGWADVRAAAQALGAATVAAQFGQAAHSDDATEAHQARVQEERQHHLDRLEACMQRVVNMHPQVEGAAGGVEQQQQEEEGKENNEEEEHVSFAGAYAVGHMTMCVGIADGQHVLVEGAAARLCRALLAAWLTAREQLQQEMVEGVVGAVQAGASGKPK